MVEKQTHKNINMYIQLDNAMQFGLYELNEKKDYFIAKIHEMETMSKTLSKYIVDFAYVDKTLSATSDVVSIASFGTVTGAPVGVVGTSLDLIFSFSNEIANKFL